MKNKKIIVLVGPSGSGKTSIGQILEAKGIPRLVTTTTREPRSDEVDGIDYYFRDFSEADMDEFVEQTIYNKNRYGITKAEVESMLEKNDVVHVSLDKQGADALEAAYPKEVYVVFVKITEEEMIERMKMRGDTQAEIEERILFSRKTDELSPPEQTDLIIQNNNLEESAQIILDELEKQKTNNKKS